MGLDVLAIFLIGALGIVVGILIGVTSIGGVVFVPALVYLFGVDLRTAIASCLFSYLFTGAAAVYFHARRGSIDWRMAGWLCGAAMPTAYLGALAVAGMPAGLLELVIGAVIALAGLDRLRRVAALPRPRQGLGRGWLAAIGGVTGFGSALTGTGGPVIMAPILLMANLPVLTVVGVSQAMVLPVGLFATIGNLAHGRIDYAIGALLAVTTVAGIAIGTRVAHAVPAVQLQRIVAAVLVAVGLLMAARVFLGG